MCVFFCKFETRIKHANGEYMNSMIGRSYTHTYPYIYIILIRNRRKRRSLSPDWHRREIGLFFAYVRNAKKNFTPYRLSNTSKRFNISLSVRFEFSSVAKVQVCIRKPIWLTLLAGTKVKLRKPKCKHRHFSHIFFFLSLQLLFRFGYFVHSTNLFG